MKLKIFYIDDEQDLCDIFEELNQSEFVQIKTFNDPATAIAAALNDSPDLVFVDFRLPGMTGDNVAFALKTEVPIYLISGDLDVRNKFAFTGIIRKPVDNSELAKIITDLLKKRSNLK